VADLEIAGHIGEPDGQEAEHRDDGQYDDTGSDRQLGKHFWHEHGDRSGILAAAPHPSGISRKQNGKWLRFGNKRSHIAGFSAAVRVPRAAQARRHEPSPQGIEKVGTLAFVQCTRKVEGRPGGLKLRSLEPSMSFAVSTKPVGDELNAALHDAVAAAEALFADARRTIAARVTVEGRPMARVFDREQRATHGLAWLATYVEAIRQLAAYAERLQAAGSFGETEELLVRIGAGEFLAQILGGIPMSQSEIVRLADLGLSTSAVAARVTPAVDHLIATGNTAPRRARLAELMRERPDVTVGACGLDETLDSIREEMRKFADGQVVPHAQQWHLRNEYIPLEVLVQMSELGVFSLTIPEDYGGMGLGKESMCVVSEELSRGYIGVGSLGTRSEIAAELILGSGTEDQKRKWLPKIASGEVLPTAVFTEPNTGSDLASLRTRAVREGNTYKVYGNKTWITHPVRADLMTLLVRTNPAESGYRGLSMLLAEKPRGDDKTPFPAPGMGGSEIEVLGYRGMKEFEIAFDGFAVKAENLLGGIEGMGFKQLMATFESARIQTAARAIGVAQAAMEQGLSYATARVQFGEPIAAFPRVSDKLAMMAVEIMIARQLTYYAARQKDSGRRCDLEAGMAKLLAARVAWAAADNAVQIHGGNGFALEFPISRILCDARILNIFEGAAEIQAHVIARRLLDGTN
jgi:(2S)-methylsuccinyl-CoA dehydrogenase